MDFNMYQRLAEMTAVYPNKGEIRGLAYATLGLAGEAGEVAGKVKKVLRGDSDLDRDALAAELGDVLWYIAAVANEIEYNLDEIADQNLRKLQSRQERGVIKGSGDNR